MGMRKINIISVSALKFNWCSFFRLQSETDEIEDAQEQETLTKYVNLLNIITPI